jgi:hypothetical protein
MGPLVTRFRPTSDHEGCASCVNVASGGTVAHISGPSVPRICPQLADVGTMLYTRAGELLALGTGGPADGFDGLDAEGFDDGTDGHETPVANERL